MRAGTACLVAALVALGAGSASGAEPIEGRWRTAHGETAEISGCGDQYCITVTTGIYKGKRIGRVSGAGKAYDGIVTDPTNERVYSGTAEVEGGHLKLTGCALKIFCRSQTWTRL